MMLVSTGLLTTKTCSVLVLHTENVSETVHTHFTLGPGLNQVKFLLRLFMTQA